MTLSSRARRRWWWGGGILFFILVLLIAARIYLGVWLLNYVNRVLDNMDGYHGSVEAIDIHLYRGAYRVHGLKIVKTGSGIPVPFLSIDTTDLSIEWGALLHGRIVSNIDLAEPVINFAINRSDTASQTGREVDWNKPIRELMPIDINLVTFREGKLTYRDFSTHPKVNVYIHHMSGEMRNLRNVEDASQALPSTLIVKGDSIGGGNLAIKGKMNVLKPVPDMDLNIALENISLPALSDYTDAYAALDIHAGKLDLYSEFVVKNNRVSGYIKPIATGVTLIDLRKESNPIKAAWQMMAAVVVEIFTNQTRDQFATKVDLEGKLDSVDTNTWSTIAGIIRNAFIEAVKRGFEGGIAPKKE